MRSSWAGDNVTSDRTGGCKRSIVYATQDGPARWKVYCGELRIGPETPHWSLPIVRWMSFINSTSTPLHLWHSPTIIIIIIVIICTILFHHHHRHHNQRRHHQRNNK